MTKWDPSRCASFWRFIAERHEMFRRRIILKQPPPWTADPVLQTVSFTNIYRELDRATRVLLRSFPPDNGDEPTNADLLFNILKFRFFTLPATYEALGGYQSAATWNPALAETVLLQRWEAGAPVFTNAFMYTGSGAPGPGGKIKAIIRRLTDIQRRLSYFTQAVFGATTMQSAHQALDTIQGFGGFMSYEVLIDVTYTGRVDYDRNSWVYIGPGAIKGLLDLLEGPVLLQNEAFVLVYALRDWQAEGFRAAGVQMNGPRLTLENIEQACCEFHKYVRAGSGGWTKRRYDSAKANMDYTLWDDLPEEFLHEEHWVR